MRIYLYVLAMLCMTVTAHANGIKPHAKPRSPLQVNIAAMQSGTTVAEIKPGDTIQFKITGKSLTDAGELNIRVELYGGVELVAGETSWSGSANKGEDKVLLITVRAPVHGDGGVRARISMSPSGGAGFAAEAEYRLGQNTLRKPAQLPKTMKDHKGREIREYRVN